MSDEKRREIMWGPSIKSLLRDFRGRLTRAENSLEALTKQDGLYADEHRAIIALYREVIGVITDHDSARQSALNAEGRHA